MVLKKAELPEKEKLEIAKDFIAEHESKADNWRIKWFVDLCKNYLENREKVDLYSEQIECLFEKEVLKKS